MKLTLSEHQAWFLGSQAEVASELSAASLLNQKHVLCNTQWSQDILRYPLSLTMFGHRDLDAGRGPRQAVRKRVWKSQGNLYVLTAGTAPACWS